MNRFTANIRVRILPVFIKQILKLERLYAKNSEYDPQYKAGIKEGLRWSITIFRQVLDDIDDEDAEIEREAALPNGNK